MTVTRFGRRMQRASARQARAKGESVRLWDGAEWRDAIAMVNRGGVRSLPGESAGLSPRTVIGVSYEELGAAGVTGQITKVSYRVRPADAEAREGRVNPEGVRHRQGGVELEVI